MRVSTDFGFRYFVTVHLIKSFPIVNVSCIFSHPILKFCEKHEYRRTRESASGGEVMANRKQLLDEISELALQMI